mmetsp:Transcript_142990/g.202239  ORF Transcript_142990/g.202239 Transcript_142990/m.202239 type:complete len:258 (-) Transcript_142990:301-1074(-)
MSWLSFADQRRDDRGESMDEGPMISGRQAVEPRGRPGPEDPFLTEALSSAPPRSVSGGVQRVYRERVLVRVYDLGQTVWTRFHNQLTKNYGAFHTGVEVYGKEWSFGMCIDRYAPGITCNEPGKNLDHAFRETLSMGYTRFSPTEVRKILEEMEREWKGRDYHVLTKNCHHFSDAFCARLGVARLPLWINTLASTGANTLDYLDNTDSGYDGGQALYDFFDNVKTSVFGFFTDKPQSPVSAQAAQGYAWPKEANSWR